MVLMHSQLAVLLLLSSVQASHNFRPLKALDLPASGYCSTTALTFQLPTEYAATSPAIASLNDGSSFVVATQVTALDGSGLGIFASIYSVNTSTADGTAHSISYAVPQFQVNTEPLFDQKNPVIAALAFGNGFVVVYESTVALVQGAPSRQQRILYQIFTVDGQRIGGESAVNEDLTKSRQDSYPAVAALLDGGFVVTWISYTVDSNGVATNGGLVTVRVINGDRTVRTRNLIHANTLGDNAFPAQSVAVSHDKHITVTWTSMYGSGSRSIQSQQFDAQGNMIGSQSQLTKYSGYGFSNPNTATLHNGRQVVAWTGVRPADQSTAIQFQIYDSNETPIGDTVVISRDSPLMESTAYILANANITFTVVWNYYDLSSGVVGIQAATFDADGQPLGGVFQPQPVNANAELSLPVGTALSSGQMVLAWTESGNIVAGQLYQCPQNCQLSTWSKYSPCSVSCGGGIRTSTRTHLSYALGGGQRCTSSQLVQSRRCNTDACPLPICTMCYGQSCYYYYTADNVTSRQLASRHCAATKQQSRLANIQSHEQRQYIINSVVNGTAIAQFWIGKYEQQDDDWQQQCLVMDAHGTISARLCDDASVTGAICQVPRPQECRPTQ